MERSGNRVRRRTRILCVNCNICVNTLRRYRVLDQNISVSSMFCKWIYPQIVTEDDYVCEACWILAENQSLHQNVSTETSSTSAQENSKQNVSEDNEPQAETRPRHHIKVCLICGCSIAQKQSDKILRENPTELQQHILNIIETKVEPRQITSSDRVCHACWVRTKREALRATLVVAARVCKAVPLHEADNPPIENPQIGQARPDTKNVPLPNYRRSANTKNHCVFPDCLNRGILYSINDRLCAIILSNHKYYVPKLARVCGDHLSGNSWDKLYHSKNSTPMFSVDHVQHIFSLVNAFDPTIDFDNYEEMDDRLFQYWIGFSKEKFRMLLEDVPRIMDIRKGKLGLFALLMKLKTGDSDERIATLMNKPRRNLEGWMNQVREVLKEDFVPRNLGIEHITREQLINHT